MRESLSADLDGEAMPLEAPTLQTHLASCAACTRFSVEVAGVARRTRIAAAEPVPDLTATIMTALASERPAGRRMRDLRVLVALAGIAQLVLALPMLVGLMSPDLHLGRDLGALQVALGVGLLFAAFQPRRAAGLLPVVAVVAGTTLVAAVIDVASGSVALAAELTHLSELVGVVALWGMTRLGAGAPTLPLAAPRSSRMEPA